ncbi:MAG: molybdopterin-dependent oxidoreductase [Chloroflexi bacterium]|nr:molybdopterin-dependent oxidoreductase [Chloroflexota bacterium]
MDAEANELTGSPRVGSGEDVWINSACGQCYSACAIRVHRVNGTVVKIEGDPDFPHNLGRVCAKGNAALITLYDPNRVKAPLRRTNLEKGIGVDPGWVEIGWEEALDLVAEKLKKTRQKNPSGLGLCNFDTQAFPFVNSWGIAFGTHNLAWNAAGYFCGAGLHLATYLTNATFHMQVDIKQCNYVILFGSQLGFGVGHGPNRSTQEMADARVRGMRLVVVDPVCAHAGSKADEWVPIRPGTDGALALAMLNVILNEAGIYDKEFIEKRTNGPYLVGSDGRYVRDEASGKPLVWATVGGIARPYDASDVAQMAILGQYTVRGLACRPAFQVLKEHVTKYSPEMASKITTIPAQTIRRIAREYAEAASIGATIVVEGKQLPYRPAAVHMYRGAYSHKHSTHHALAIQLLNIVIGNVYAPGGHFGINPVGPWWETGESPDGLLVAAREVQRNRPPYHFLSTRPEPPKAHGLESLFPIAFATSVPLALGYRDHEKFGLPPLDMLVQCRCNVMMTTIAPEETAKALKKVGFMVSFANYLDETAQFADIVFPDAHHLERFDPNPNEPYTSQCPTSGYWYWGLRQPTSTPPFKAPHWLDLLIELADRAGFLEDYNTVLTTFIRGRKPLKLDRRRKYSFAELSDAYIKAKMGDDNMGLDWFREHGHHKVKRKVEHDYPTLVVHQRIPLYFEHFLAARDYVEQITKAMDLAWDTRDYTPLMEWMPCSAFEPKAGGYDLFVVNYTLPFHQYSITPQNPWLSEITERHPYAQKIMMNSATARRLGLKDGADVWVETPERRRVKGKLKVTECVHPEVVAIAGVFGAWSDGKPIAKGKGAHFNSLLPLDMDHVDMISGSADACERVKVYPDSDV